MSGVNWEDWAALRSSGFTLQTFTKSTDLAAEILIHNVDQNAEGDESDDEQHLRPKWYMHQPIYH